MTAKKGLGEKLIADLEAKYQQVKKQQIEELHNAFGAAIDQIKPDAQTLLYVLEMIRFEVLSQKFGEMFMKGGEAPLDIKKEEGT